MPIDRREFLRRAALVVGTGLSTSCVSAVMSRPSADARGSARGLLSAVERAVLEAACERILPRTDTPGALDAGVPDFVEFVLADGYPADARAAYRASLQGLDADARREAGVGFAALSAERQDAALQAVELAEFAAGAGAPALFAGFATTKPFFAATKELTLVGFYTSEVGLQAERTYSHYPGVFDGSRAWKPGQKPWAGGF